jgi:mRNA interferase RelE/StbE
MSYEITISRVAQKELAALDRQVYERVKVAVLALADDPRPTGCLKLSGREGWRIRVGNYRVIYEIDDTVRIVSIVHVGHRGRIYR